MSTKMECTLLEQNYTLACPEGGEALMQMAVQIVDEEIAAILQAGRIRARERVAVLAALNLAYRLAEQAMAPPPPPPSIEDPFSDAAVVERLITQLEAVLVEAPHTAADPGLPSAPAQPAGEA